MPVQCTAILCRDKNMVEWTSPWFSPEWCFDKVVMIGSQTNEKNISLRKGCLLFLTMINATQEEVDDIIWKAFDDTSFKGWKM